MTVWSERSLEPWEAGVAACEEHPRADPTRSRFGDAGEPLPDPEAVLPLRFVRHGATAPNQAGLRCGGDLDVPLVELGRRQADDAGVRIARLRPRVGLIVTSDMLRTRETAALIAKHLPGVPILVEPGFAERRLGGWNLRSVNETQPWLKARKGLTVSLWLARPRGSAGATPKIKAAIAT